MKIRLLFIAGLSGLLLAGPVIAQAPSDRPTGDGKFEMRKGLTKQERKHMRKSMKHRQMARQHGRQMMQHRMMAREHGMMFRNEHIGPMMSPDKQMGRPRHMRFPKNMEFQDEQFAPPMHPNQMMGPPQHMRFREGKNRPRAL